MWSEMKYVVAEMEDTVIFVPRFFGEWGPTMPRFMGKSGLSVHGSLDEWGLSVPRSLGEPEL